MSSVYFISDLHLGHRSICKYRTEFSSTDEHDTFIKQRILDTLGKRDKLWLLGDIAFTEEAGDWVVELSKKHHIEIVLGNHCSDNSVRQANLAKYIQAGIKIHSLVSYRNCWLTHCPIHPDEIRSRELVIYGHTHSHNVDDPRYFNVSCENIDYTPIKFSEIKERVYEESN